MDAETLLAELPRTECRQCGYPGCAPYAAAVAAGRAPPDACAPGGAWVRDRLRLRLGLPRDPAEHVLAAPYPAPVRARIDEEWCIGCTKCLDACPVDAIIGAAHQLHAVLAFACTGCGLCVPPCPVDCIEMVAPAAVGSGSDAARRATEHDPCVPCGRCAPVCPEGLDPERLFRTVTTLDLTGAQNERLTACTGCGRCDEVCPSRIPLATTFAHAKAASATIAEADAASRQAVTRVAARERRLSTGPGQSATPAMPTLAAIGGAPASREIAAAVARAKAGHAAAGAPRET